MEDARSVGSGRESIQSRSSAARSVLALKHATTALLADREKYKAEAEASRVLIEEQRRIIQQMLPGSRSLVEDRDAAEEVRPKIGGRARRPRLAPRPPSTARTFSRLICAGGAAAPDGAGTTAPRA